MLNKIPATGRYVKPKGKTYLVKLYLKYKHKNTLKDYCVKVHYDMKLS